MVENYSMEPLVRVVWDLSSRKTAFHNVFGMFMPTDVAFGLIKDARLSAAGINGGRSLGHIDHAPAWQLNLTEFDLLL